MDTAQKDMRYIILGMGKELVVLFQGNMEHAAFLERGFHIVAAGFVQILPPPTRDEEYGIFCYPNLHLNIMCRPETDAKLIKAQLEKMRS